MKTAFTTLVFVLLSQYALADDLEITIPTKCQAKLTEFSTHFARASMMNFGDTEVTLGKVNVNPKAKALGESGFADGSGSYLIAMIDEGKTLTVTINFNFRFAGGPHCAVMRIELSRIQ